MIYNTLPGVLEHLKLQQLLMQDLESFVSLQLVFSLVLHLLVLHLLVLHLLVLHLLVLHLPLQHLLVLCLCVLHLIVLQGCNLYSASICQQSSFPSDRVFCAAAT